MSTDTIYLLNDTLVAKLNLVNNKIPVVIENSASANDTQGWIIVLIICLTVIAVTCMITSTISEWHKDAISINKKNPIVEPSQEEKDKKEYISKLISFREELAKNDLKMKAEDNSSCIAYITLLTELAKKGKIE